MSKRLFKLGTLPLLLLSSLPAFAATPVDLSHQSASILFSDHRSAADMKEVSRSTDFNQTMHIRVKQMYQGYPVWGADAVVHMPHADSSGASLMSMTKAGASMNGIMYQNLQADLVNTPSFVFNKAQAETAEKQAINAYQQKTGTKAAVTEQSSQLLVYIDKDNKAHWAYKVRFYVAPAKAKQLPERPVYILDAVTFDVYEQWNDIQTHDAASGGGFGGNVKMGKVSYDGLGSNLPILQLQRNAASKLCYMQNADVTVLDKRNGGAVMTYSCTVTDTKHNNIYWNADHDAANGAYSPSNDALYYGSVIKQMYRDWYGVPVLSQNGKAIMLNMAVHEDLENAYWDPDTATMTFGDGGSMLYPLTSLGVSAHEISHGFTSQHSDLTYRGQSGGMNEAFSDMAAKAAEYYAYGKDINWEIGPEIFKADEALRYLDKPSKDCKVWPYLPGWLCSIDDAKQYGYGWLDVHHSSGVYNHFFYFLANTKGWNTKKAFDVVVKANSDYWTPNSTFVSGACGVISATKDYARKDASYDIQSVVDAFNKVKIDTSKC